MEKRTASIFDLVRMCKSFGDRCKGCPLDGSTAICRRPFEFTEKDNDAIITWCDEHPQKTYAQYFFEKFPNARKDSSGNPVPCRKDVFGSPKGVCDTGCPACWNEVMLEND